MTTTDPLYCYVNISPQNGQQIILGDVFFRGYIITFDRTQNQMGFYDKYKAQSGSISLPSFISGYFVYTQFIICGFNVVGGLLGLILWIRSMQLLKGKGIE